MTGSIADFKASFTTDLARSNKFDVQLPIPLGMVPYLGTSRKLAFRDAFHELRKDFGG